ncbi:MFS transporter [Aquisalimonas sp. APHAB1-3]|uniref:MFS transporter n=1 Tax=Aquisalimonas sp. APHAB1-3 TaxID=3402080 RepID=UPI003AAC9CCA
MTTAAPAGEKRNVAILAINQALFLITAITVMTLGGLVGQQLAATPALATLPVAAMMVGTVTFTLPASLFMKRYGRRPGFLIGTICGGGLGGATAVAGIVFSSFWLFCLGNLLLGLYQGFAMYYRFAAADVASDAFRSRAISLVMAGGVIAAFLGPWNASQATTLFAAAPNAGPYAMVIALALAGSGLLAFLRVPAASEPAPDAVARPFATIAGQPAFRVALMAAAVGYAIMILVMTATPLAMQAEGFGMREAATVMQWHVLGMFAPSFITGHLIARFGLGNMLLTGCAVLVASVFVAVSGASFTHFLAALILLGIGWNFLFVGGSTLLTQTHTPAERGKTQGANDLVVFSLVAVGSLLSGLLLYSVGWTWLNLLMLPAVLVTAVGVWRLQHTQEVSAPAG